MIIRLIAFFIVFLLYACSANMKILRQMETAYQTEYYSISGYDYIHNNRKMVLQDLSKYDLNDVDSLILLEYQDVQDWSLYECSVFTDSLIASYSNSSTSELNKLGLNGKNSIKYIFNKIKENKIEDILMESKNPPYRCGGGYYHLSIIRKKGNSVNVSGFVFDYFIPKPKLRVSDSLKNLIRQHYKDK